MHDDFGKKIVIYGAGFEAERFLCYRKDEFDVEFYIDRIANRTFHGKQVYAIEEVPEDIQHKKILVAASEPGYYEISKILEGKGLIEYQIISSKTIWTKIFFMIRAILLTFLLGSL